MAKPKRRPQVQTQPQVNVRMNIVSLLVLFVFCRANYMGVRAVLRTDAKLP